MCIPDQSTRCLLSFEELKPQRSLKKIIRGWTPLNVTLWPWGLWKRGPKGCVHPGAGVRGPVTKHGGVTTEAWAQRLGGRGWGGRKQDAGSCLILSPSRGARSGGGLSPTSASLLPTQARGWSAAVGLGVWSMLRGGQRRGTMFYRHLVARVALHPGLSEPLAFPSFPRAHLDSSRTGRCLLGCREQSRCWRYPIACCDGNRHSCSAPWSVIGSEPWSPVVMAANPAPYPCPIADPCPLLSLLWSAGGTVLS